MMTAFGLDSYSTDAIAILVVTALIAGLARGFSGFGAALIFMPVASAVLTTRIASPLLLLVDFVTALPLLPGALNYADRREVAWLTLGSLIGVPLGTWALTVMNPLALRWMIVAVIVPMLALLMSGWRYPGRTSLTVTTLVGGTSGFFNGAAEVGGPPLIFYMLRDAGKALTMRASLIVLFAISNLISFPSYFIAGLWSWSVVGLALAVGPAYGIGIWLGAYVFRFASEAMFRRICYGLIAFAALVSLPVFDGWLR